MSSSLALSSCVLAVRAIEVIDTTAPSGLCHTIGRGIPAGIRHLSLHRLTRKPGQCPDSGTTANPFLCGVNGNTVSTVVSIGPRGRVNGGLRHSLLLALCQCVPLLPAAGPVTVTGRPAEIPSNGLPQSDRQSPHKAGGGVATLNVTLLDHIIQNQNSKHRVSKICLKSGI